MPRKCDICGSSHSVMRDEKTEFLICNKCYNKLMEVYQSEQEMWEDIKKRV